MVSKARVELEQDSNQDEGNRRSRPQKFRYNHMAPGLLNKPQRQSQKLPVIAYLWKSILFQRHPVCQDQSMTAFCRCGVRTPTLGVTNAQAFHALCSTRRSKEMHIVAFSKPLQQNTTCVKFRLPIPKGLQAQATGTQGCHAWCAVFVLLSHCHNATGWYDYHYCNCDPCPAPHNEHSTRITYT